MTTVSTNGYLSCEHDDEYQHELRVYTASNGARQFRIQCMVCGGQVGKAIPKTEIWTSYKVPPGQVPEWDRELIDEWRERQHRHSQQLWAEKQRQWERDKEHLQAQRRSDREAYMMTAKWRSIRDKALKRDGYTCQGCLEARAAVAHHTTYERLGNELLIDLVSLCHRCHDRAHGKEPSAVDVSQFVANLR